MTVLSSPLTSPNSGLINILARYYFELQKLEKLAHRLPESPEAYSTECSFPAREKYRGKLFLHIKHTYRANVAKAALALYKW